MRCGKPRKASTSLLSVCSPPTLLSFFLLESEKEREIIIIRRKRGQVREGRPSSCPPFLISKLTTLENEKKKKGRQQAKENKALHRLECVKVLLERRREKGGRSELNPDECTFRSIVCSTTNCTSLSIENISSTSTTFYSISPSSFQSATVKVLQQLLLAGGRGGRKTF